MKFLKTLKFAAALMFFTLLLSSCQDDDPYANLTGTYTLSSSTVDGASAGPVSGTLRFNANKTGEIDITYVAGNTQYTLEGGFNFTADDTQIILNPGASDEEKWKRVEDEKNKQSFAFDVTQAGDVKGVVLTFTK